MQQYILYSSLEAFCQRLSKIVQLNYFVLSLKFKVILPITPIQVELVCL